MESLMPYLPILVAAIVNFVIGMFWYSPLLFGNAWMKAIGMTDQDLEKAKEKGMAGNMVAGFVNSVVVAVVLDYVLTVAGAGSYYEALMLAAIVWVGFVVTNNLGGVIWENYPKKAFFIHTFYSLATYLAMAAVLVAMA